MCYIPPPLWSSCLRVLFLWKWSPHNETNRTGPYRPPTALPIGSIKRCTRSGHRAGQQHQRRRRQGRRRPLHRMSHSRQSGLPQTPVDPQRKAPSSYSFQFSLVWFGYFFKSKTSLTYRLCTRYTHQAASPQTHSYIFSIRAEVLNTVSRGRISLLLRRLAWAWAWAWRFSLRFLPGLSSWRQALRRVEL